MPQPHVTGHTRPTKTKRQMRAQKRKRDDVNVEKLSQAIQDLEPQAPFKSFDDLPLSAFTKAGLKAAHYVELTDIQARAIPLALKGKDILGAAKTGSGKTLAFLIPVLENLYRARCIGGDAGLGAMIISPTRELAIQIFDVLRKIGRQGHMFAAGLIIGGKALAEERGALARMNIVVCTPGRILQHLSQTASFNVDNLQMLVLDEADRIMDLGFQHDVDAILEYLPKERQTLLFSATQTKRLSDLARLSLQNPEYLSVHEAASTATPSTLQQNYILTPLHEKLDTLWSFLQTAKKAKTLVFLSAGKQVRFVFESFRRMQPGVPLLHLHGRQKQHQRLEITKRFSVAKYSCLFATDVAARGLDFPAVDWVVQVDCPEDADTYIHRVGRTARFQKTGRAVLFLEPSEEEGFLKRLETKRVPVERINVRQKKKQSITDAVANLCFKDPQLKYLGQKAFTSYVRSVYLQSDKEVFRLEKLPLEEFASSLGLPGAPRIKFLKADSGEMKNRKNAQRDVAGFESSDEENDGSEDDVAKSKKQDSTIRTKYDRMFERTNQDVFAAHYSRLVREDEDRSSHTTSDGRNDQIDGLNDDEQAPDDDDDDDEAFLNVKRRIAADDDIDIPGIPTDNPETKLVYISGAKAPLLIDSKRAEKRLKSKKKLLKYKEKGTRLTFDDEGKAHAVYELEDAENWRETGRPEEQRRTFVQGERERLKAVDVGDKAIAKAKKREKLAKRREREKRQAEDDGAAAAQYGSIAAGLKDARENFLQDAEVVSQSDADKIDERPTKRKRKWFEENRGEKRNTVDEAETLEDLEAMAKGLLA